MSTGRLPDRIIGTGEYGIYEAELLTGDLHRIAVAAHPAWAGHFEYGDTVLFLGLRPYVFTSLHLSEHLLVQTPSEAYGSRIDTWGLQAIGI